MIKFIGFFCLLILSRLECQSLEIKCQHDGVYIPFVTYVSICNADKFCNKNPNTVVTNVTGPWRSYTSLTFFRIENQVCHFLPKNMEKFFPILRKLDVVNSGLLELTQQDLSVFPNLRSIDMKRNNLVSLDKNLFEKNEMITSIDFRYNKLQFIAADAFKPLKHLAYAWFEGNVCVSKDDWMSEGELVDTMKSSCSNNVLPPKVKPCQSGEKDGKCQEEVCEPKAQTETEDEGRTYQWWMAALNLDHVVPQKIEK